MDKLSLIDERIKRLEKLRKLLADPETAEILADPELRSLIFAANNGAADIVRHDGQQGTLSEVAQKVLSIAKGLPDSFDAKSMVAKVKEAGVRIGATDEQVSMNGTLRDLFDRGYLTKEQQGIGRRPTLYKYKK